MKIVHVISSLDPRAGGPPAVALRVAVAQARLGHNVAVLAQEAQGRAAMIDESLEQVDGVDQVSLHRVVVAGRISAVAAGPLLRSLRPLLMHCDGVHLHGVWEPVLLRTAAAARRAGVVYAITPHGMLYPYCLDQKALKKRLSLMLAHRRMLNRATFIHALNADEARAMAPLKLHPRIVVVPNAMDTSVVDRVPNSDAFLAAHPHLRDQAYFLFVGRLHPIKGLDVLVDAFAEYRRRGGNMHLVLVGPDDGVQQDLERRIAELQIRPFVSLIGPLFGAQKFEAIKACKAYVQTSRHETFSMAVTEALAFGKPVVITDTCHFPEIAELGAGLVTPLDAASIADALLRIESSPQELERMGGAGRRLVKERFTWPHVAEQLAAAFYRSGDSAAVVDS